jgi:hypothetical protein
MDYSMIKVGDSTERGSCETFCQVPAENLTGPKTAASPIICKNGRFFGPMAQTAIAVPSWHRAGRQRATAATSVAPLPAILQRRTDGNF